MWGGRRGGGPQAGTRRRQERKRDLETGLVKTPVGNTVRDTQRRRWGEGAARRQRETPLPDAALVPGAPGGRKVSVEERTAPPDAYVPLEGTSKTCLLETERPRDASETG